MRIRGVRRLKQLLHPDVPTPVREPASLPEGPHSPHLRFDTGEAVLSEHLRAFVRERNRRGRFLDVGGGAGHHKQFAGPFEYVILDLEPRPGGIVGDICDCPQIADASFDVVYSHNTLEHLARPWLAAREIGRILRPGGLAAIYTWFGIRYHPVPSDYWRFTHEALKLLFEDEAGLETLDCGYDLRYRRDNRNDKIPGHLDMAPEDELGGWLENWPVWYVGRKPTTT